MRSSFATFLAHWKFWGLLFQANQITPLHLVPNKLFNWSKPHNPTLQRWLQPFNSSPIIQPIQDHSAGPQPNRSGLRKKTKSHLHRLHLLLDCVHGRATAAPESKGKTGGRVGEKVSFHLSLFPPPRPGLPAALSFQWSLEFATEMQKR